MTYFSFRSKWNSLIIVRATQLVDHLILIIVELYIINEKIESNFMEGLIQRIGKSSNMKELTLKDTDICVGEEGQELGMQLTE